MNGELALDGEGAGARGHRIRTVLAFGSVWLIWGSTYLGIRICLETLPPMLMSGMRFILAGAILYLLARRTGAAPPTRRHWRTAAFIGTMLIVGGNGLIVLAEERIPSGLTALLVCGTPMWMALLDGLGLFAPPGGRRPGRPDRATFLGLAAGILGVGILVGGGELGAGNPIDPTGVLLVLAASGTWTVGSLYSRSAALPRSLALTTGMEMLAGGAMMLAAGLLSGESSRMHLELISGRSALAFAYLVLAGSLAGYTSYLWLLKHSTPALVSTYAYVNPVIAVLLGWAVAGEQLPPRMIVAAGFIVGALVLVTRARR